MKRHHDDGDNSLTKRRKISREDQCSVSPFDITELFEAILANLVTLWPLALIKVYSVCKRFQVLILSTSLWQRIGFILMPKDGALDYNILKALVSQLEVNRLNQEIIRMRFEVEKLKQNKLSEGHHKQLQADLGSTSKRLDFDASEFLVATRLTAEAIRALFYIRKHMLFNAILLDELIMFIECTESDVEKFRNLHLHAGRPIIPTKRRKCNFVFSAKYFLEDPLDLNGRPCHQFLEMNFESNYCNIHKMFFDTDRSLLLIGMLFLNKCAFLYLKYNKKLNIIDAYGNFCNERAKVEEDLAEAMEDKKAAMDFMQHLEFIDPDFISCLPPQSKKKCFNNIKFKL